MSRHCRWLVPAAMAGALVLLAGTAVAAPGWTVVSIPRTSSNSELNGVFATTNNDVWAVGLQYTPSPTTLAYHWNGSTWTLVSTPALTATNASLNAVSAISASDAWAVGFTQVSGHIDQTLMEHWNGTAWSVDSSGNVSGYNVRLEGVVDLGPANAWAVGGQGLVMHWNGTAWSSVAVPAPNPSDTAGNNLTSITAVSPSDIWAVGEFTNTSFTNSAYAEHFNGSTWSVSILPQPTVSGPSSPVLHGVTAVSSSNVWTVGENEEVPGLGITTLIEHWNGTAWSIVPSPTPGAYPMLNAVAARGASDVYAVGSNEPSVNGGVQQGLILRWNGTSWSADSDPSAGTFSPLYGAATFPGSTSEWAAGINSSDQAVVLSHS